MLIALAGERPFATPRTRFELDLDAILRAAGLEESRFVPFNNYPCPRRSRGRVDR